jgi:hypothetical protein
VVVVKSTRMRWRGVWHIRWRGEVDTGFWGADLRETDHLEDLDVDENIKRIFKSWDGETWTGCIWLRLWTGGGLL